jgi:DNA polymerase-3 subunit beta
MNMSVTSLDRADTEQRPTFAVATDRATLALALATVAPAVYHRPPVPLLAGVLLEGTEDGELTVSCCNYDSSITVRVAGAATAPGRLLVDHAELTRLLAAITKGARKRDADAQPVTVTASDAGDALVGLAGYSVPVTTYVHDEEYPTLTTVQRTIAHLDRPTFVRELARVLTAVGTDDSLPVFTGVRMWVGDGAVGLTATDRYRLAAAHLRAVTAPPPTTTGGITQVVVPGQILGKVLTRFTGDHVRISTDGRAGSDDVVVGLTCGAVSVATKVLVDQFPDLDALLRPSVVGIVEVDRAGLLAEVQRTAAICDAKRQTMPTIVLSVGVDTLTATPLLAAGTSMGPDVRARVDGLVGRSVGFAVEHLTDALRCFSGDTVTMHLSADHRPVTFTDLPQDISDSTTYQHVLIPRRLPER